MSNKKRKNSDICVQTDFEQIQTTKDAQTLTDAFVCGDTEENVFDYSDSVQLGFGDNNTKYAQNRTNPFLDDFDDSTATIIAISPFSDDFDDSTATIVAISPFSDDFNDSTATIIAISPFSDDFDDSTATIVAISSFSDDFDDSTATLVARNPFITGATSNPLLLYQGENEEPPEIDPRSFEVDEPQLIAIFQNSQNSFSLVDNPCPQDFATNPFLLTYPFKLKNTNPFKGSVKENTNLFSGVSELKNSVVRNTSVSQNQDGFSPAISRPKWSLKRKLNKLMSWIKF
ncbi:hypothetical protein AVEN_96998-1 [Araneus ventricosus]|uniref:Uncharacterized protein n=1 Tax=Araneus ventricosus TaxID=182803 RepID=A0A4Y2FSI7_ARAVE|nr:hypothetical protein AVEN_96998-1 [Araneus ventricosus]